MAGINLTSHKQQNWAKAHLTRIILLLVWGVLLCVVYYFVEQNNQQSIQAINKLREMKQTQNNQLENLEEKVNKLKLALSPSRKEHITLKNYALFLSFIQNTPFNGGIQHIQMLHDKQDRLKITGNMPEPQFLALEEEMKKQHLHFSIEHFKITEDNLAEFILNLEGSAEEKE